MTSVGARPVSITAGGASAAEVHSPGRPDHSPMLSSQKDLATGVGSVLLSPLVTVITEPLVFKETVSEAHDVRPLPGENANMSMSTSNGSITNFNIEKMPNSPQRIPNMDTSPRDHHNPHSSNSPSRSFQKAVTPVGLRVGLPSGSDSASPSMSHVLPSPRQDTGGGRSPNVSFGLGNTSRSSDRHPPLSIPRTVGGLTEAMVAVGRNKQVAQQQDNTHMSASALSWRKIPNHTVNATSPFTSAIHGPAKSYHTHTLQAAFSIFYEYMTSLTLDKLKTSLDRSLTMLLMDSDVMTSLDMPSMNNSGGNPVIESLLKSPQMEMMRKQRKDVEVSSRDSFSSMTPDQLLDYCCQAHSALVVLADLLATPSSPVVGQFPAAASRLGDASSIFLPVGSSFVGGGSSQFNSLRGRARFADQPAPQKASGLSVFNTSSTSHDFKLAQQQATEAYACPSESHPADKTSFVLDNVQHAKSVMMSNGMGAFDSSVASQYLEPVHETLVANRTRDELGVKMLNNYLMLDTLGQGACGKVKLGYNVDKGQSVAIKVVRRSKTSNQFSNQSATSKIEALQREIAVMKKLRHKNIVSLYEVIDDPEAAKLYLVMQYVDDGPIAKMRPDGSCDTRPAEEVAMYARQVCAGLEYLHQKGIVHRDIKPENILVSSNKQAFLADFGVSEIFAGDQYTTKKHMGTPLFMAPELWRLTEELNDNPFMAESVRSNHSDIGLDGYALDIWALGVTFYMLLFGRPPYSDVSVLQRDVVPAPHFPEAVSTSVPSEWLQLIRRMLDPKPYKRPQISVVRSAVKKIEKSIQRKASDVDPLPSRSSFTVPEVVLEEVKTAITPRVMSPRASLTSPSASMRKSVALRSFLHAHNTIITGPNGPADRRASLTQVPSQFTPFSPPIAIPSVYRTARYGSIKQGAETESPMLQSSLQSATAASTTLAYDELRLQTELCHDVPSSRRKTVEPNGGDSAGESMRDLLESSGPTRPLPPAYRPPHDGSPRVVGLRQPSGSAQVVNAEASNKETFEDAFGDDGSRRMSISNSQKRLTFTTSRGVSRPVIVVEDAEKFDVDSSS